MAVAVAVAVSGGVAVPVAVPVAGLTKRFFNQKDFLINVWGYDFSTMLFVEIGSEELLEALRREVIMIACEDQLDRRRPLKGIIGNATTFCAEFR